VLLILRDLILRQEFAHSAIRQFVVSSQDGEGPTRFFIFFFLLTRGGWRRNAPKMSHLNAEKIMKISGCKEIYSSEFLEI
jgi:hypothetical protein